MDIRTQFYALASVILWATTLLTEVHGTSISAWSGNGLPGPQIAMYDDATGKIYYSLCNSKSIPIFPRSDATAFQLDQKPLNGTFIAATGYANDQGVVTTLLHYQEEGGGIVHSSFTCNSTGHYNRFDYSYIVSNGVPPSILHNTGLAVLNLGQKLGYRVYYKDAKNSVAALRYDPLSQKWAFDGFIYQGPTEGQSLGAAFLQSNDITVITADIGNDDKDLTTMEVCSLDGDHWSLRSFPMSDVTLIPPFKSNSTGVTNETVFDPNLSAWNGSNGDPLDAFNGSAVNIGLTLDPDGLRRVFFIGTDRWLHQHSESPSNHSNWRKDKRPGKDAWPPADEGQPSFGVTYTTDHGRDEIWIYYMVDRNLTQIHQSSTGKWDTAKTIPNHNIKDPDSKSGLSRTTNIAIGVGVGVGCTVIIATAACYLFRRAKKSRESRHINIAGASVPGSEVTQMRPGTNGVAPPSTTSGSPAPGYTSRYWGKGQFSGGHLVSSSGTHRSYTNDPMPVNDTGTFRQPPETVYEMPYEEQAHEMAADSGSEAVRRAHWT